MKLLLFIFLLRKKLLFLNQKMMHISVIPHQKRKGNDYSKEFVNFVKCMRKLSYFDKIVFTQILSSDLTREFYKKEITNLAQKLQKN